MESDRFRSAAAAAERQLIAAGRRSVQLFGNSNTLVVMTGKVIGRRRRWSDQLGVRIAGCWQGSVAVLAPVVVGGLGGCSGAAPGVPDPGGWTHRSRSSANG